MIRPDLIFSYWIFAWFLLYIMKIIYFSPKFVIFLALFQNIANLLYIAIKNAPYIVLIKYCVVIICIKFIPFYVMRNDTIKISDIMFTFFLFLVYLIWLYMNNITVFEVYKKIGNALLHNTNEIPGFYVINYISEGYIHLFHTK